VAGVVAVGGGWLASGAAQAYPPGTAISLSAISVTPTPAKDKYVVVLGIGHAQPGCLLKISVNGQTLATATADASNSAGATITLRPNDGDHITTIKVKSSCKPKESATTQVRLARAHLEGPDECKRNKSCTIEAENYPAHATVVFTATKGGVSTSIVRTATTDSKGKAHVEFSLPQEGAWAIVGVSGGESHTWWVQVKK
jgi:hypothetical protein